MAFPLSPTNGQYATLNGITYQYDSANTAWYRVPAAAASVTLATNGILYNSNTITSNVVFASGYNGLSVGPLTIPSGITVTMQANTRHVII